MARSRGAGGPGKRGAQLKAATGHLHAVIMAGGSGTRFWPLGRAARPKQFLKVAGDSSLLAATYRRLGGLVPPDRVLVVTGRDHAALVERELPELPAGRVLAEPEGRDTAAAIGWAAAYLAARDPETVMLVLPADHVIRPEDRFRQVVRDACVRAAQADKLVTFGVTPSRPATGYGYIETASEPRVFGSIRVSEVASFREKPDAATALRYVQSGRHFWNAGIFLWRARRILDELRRHVPELAGGLDRLAAGESPERVYPGLQKISIDYAVMEKARDVEVVAADFGWDDVGSWSALAGHLEQDERGNATSGLVRALAAAGNVVVAHEGHLVALLGVDGLVVVTTPDATLVCPKDRAEEVKALVERLRATGLEGRV